MTRTAGEVVIAGGGIGGLAAALALAKRGIASVVCEKRAEFSEDGAGIQIGPNGSRILQALGVGDALRGAIATPDALSVRNAASGAELTRLPLGRWIAERHGAPYWTARRRDLHEALVTAAARETSIEVRLGAEVLNWSERADGVDVALAGGESVRARALIAADGLWSNLRAQISDAAPPAPTGKNAFRCVVPRAKLPQVLAANDVHIWLAPGAHAVHYPVRGGDEIALVLIVDDARSDSVWSVAAAPDLSNTAVSRFAPPLRALLEAGADWRTWSLHTAAPLDCWTKGRVALLGDAAHPVLPFLAQGAALALEDAVVLADSLAANPGDAATALSTYAALRRPRANRVAAAATSNGRIYHMRGPLAFARDAVLRTSPAARLMAGYDWVYGWRK
ncbi:MAG: FAD-dependent monooxygenase [Hyphomicrobium sp.]